jgi:hypothetical protein
MSDDAIKKILLKIGQFESIGDDGDNGWLFNDDDIEKAAKQIHEFIDRNVIGEDEKTHPDWCGTYEQASERIVCSCGLYPRNELRTQQRQKLS